MFFGFKNTLFCYSSNIWRPFITQTWRSQEKIWKHFMMSHISNHTVMNVCTQKSKWITHFWKVPKREQRPYFLFTQTVSKAPLSFLRKVINLHIHFWGCRDYYETIPWVYKFVMENLQEFCETFFRNTYKDSSRNPFTIFHKKYSSNYPRNLYWNSSNDVSRY